MSWRQALLRAVANPQELFDTRGNADALKLLLMRLCAVYLTEKRAANVTSMERHPQRRDEAAAQAHSTAEPGVTARQGWRAIDKVADFHFANGAMLESVHWRCAACPCLFTCLQPRLHTSYFPCRRAWCNFGRGIIWPGCLY
jgi:Malonyl-CoA decarboxylase C-terminal domain